MRFNDSVSRSLDLEFRLIPGGGISRMFQENLWSRIGRFVRIRSVHLFGKYFKKNYFEIFTGIYR